jgi:hypothetical protein
MELYILKTDSCTCLYQQVSSYLANPQSRLVTKLVSLGICVKSFYETEGKANLIMLVEAPTDEAAQKSYAYMYRIMARFNPQFKRFSKSSL